MCRRLFPCQIKQMLSFFRLHHRRTDTADLQRDLRIRDRIHFTDRLDLAQCLPQQFRIKTACLPGCPGLGTDDIRFPFRPDGADIDTQELIIISERVDLRDRPGKRLDRAGAGQIIRPAVSRDTGDSQLISRQTFRPIVQCPGIEGSRQRQKSLSFAKRRIVSSLR